MSQPTLVLFEDQYFAQLLPLAYFRPVWALRCGMRTLAQKIEQDLGQSPLFAARTYLEETVLPGQRLLSVLPPEADILMVNGRLLGSSLELEVLNQLPPGEALDCDGQLVAARLTRDRVQKFRTNGIVDAAALKDTLNSQAIGCTLIQYPWDLIRHHQAEMAADFHALSSSVNAVQQPPSFVHLLGAENTLIAPDVSFKPGVVLDAEEGPIVIESGVEIMANAVIQGPAWIGRGSRIKIGAKIYGGTAIGPICKVGGEVEGSILQSYVNKQHEGFLGHAYLGSWVNLGADTNNSDLKNNYGPVRVLFNGKTFDTGMQFLGLIMGDHSKTAINTMFNTGTIVGVNCNIFGAGMPPKFVPSFSWGGAEGLAPYRLEKAMEVAERVMARRDVPFGDRERRLFEAVWTLATQTEQRSADN
ncbi:MAG: hypothetical protein D6715_11405 [Calditrichaeota bacterium]|nr:MAG: hypothetical protein D6715_11405 [Calditrichota bacterium]